VLGGALLAMSPRIVEAAPECPRLIALDAGHSPGQPGATSARGRSEHGFNLRLADEVQAALEGARFTVRRLPAGSLDERAAAAAGADLMLSLHHDSVQERFLEAWSFEGARRMRTRHAQGHSLFVSANNTEFDRSRRWGEALGAALVRRGLQPTQHHAEPIDGENRPLIDRTIGLYRFDGLRVLRKAPVPALLLEAAVITHDEDELRAEDPEYRQRIVDAIVETFSAGCPAR